MKFPHEMALRMYYITSTGQKKIPHMSIYFSYV